MSNSLVTLSRRQLLLRAFECAQYALARSFCASTCASMLKYCCCCCCCCCPTLSSSPELSSESSSPSTITIITLSSLSAYCNDHVRKCPTSGLQCILPDCLAGPSGGCSRNRLQLSLRLLHCFAQRLVSSSKAATASAPLTSSLQTPSPPSARFSAAASSLLRYPASPLARNFRLLYQPSF